MTPLNTEQKLTVLKKMTAPKLRKCWSAVFGVEAASWTPPEALIEKLAEHFEKIPHDLIGKSMPHTAANAAPKTIRYQPVPGVKRRRMYKGELHTVEELEGGFKYQGEIYRSYSAIAKKITGQQRDGMQFFGMKPSAPKCTQVFR